MDKSRGVTAHLVNRFGSCLGTLALARCSAKLALNDVDSAALERMMKRLRHLGAVALPLLGDASDYERVQQIAGEAVAEFGNVVGLVNIPGAHMPRHILDRRDICPTHVQNCWLFNTAL